MSCRQMLLSSRLCGRNTTLPSFHTCGLKSTPPLSGECKHTTRLSGALNIRTNTHAVLSLLSFLAIVTTVLIPHLATVPTNPAMVLTSLRRHIDILLTTLSISIAFSLESLHRVSVDILILVRTLVQPRENRTTVLPRSH